jgi:hypothetical protein
MAALVGAITIALSGAVSAQEDTGVSIDPNVFNMYLESRIQRPAAEATPDQVAAVRDELTDIYRYLLAVRSTARGGTKRRPALAGTA